MPKETEEEPGIEGDEERQSEEKGHWMRLRSNSFWARIRGQPRQNEASDAHEFEGYDDWQPVNSPAEEAWAEFVMDKRPAALARYLQFGGEVDEQVRVALINVLEHDPRGRRGGSKPFRDWETYLAVEEILFNDRLDRRHGSSSGEEIPKKPMSLRQALLKYAKSTEETDLKRVERQYKRGKKVDAKFG